MPLTGMADQQYIQELIDRARADKLAERAAWHKLLHYKPNTFSGYTSQLVSRNFFNDPNGRYDPQAELDATIKSFFSDVRETDKVQNPQCLFIARYAWLKKELKFDPKRLKPRTCKRFQEWYKTINPKYITMIFPAGTDNSPASMFGHTLLRLDREEFNEKNRLTSYGINFAAENNGEGGLAYTFKGLFGGYPGKFSIVPYYEKVNQYNQMENRDIWEYQLDFTQQEIKTILMHTWELGPNHFQYFFFSQNCSYHLLSLFEVARPRLNLTDNFNWFAIPSDTVKVTLEEEGILKKVVYRPSARTKLQHRLTYLSSDEKDMVIDIVDGEITPQAQDVQALPETRRALVLETAHDFLLYRRVDEGVEGGELRKRSFGILRARSKLNAKSDIKPVPVPKVRIDQGHSTSRISMGVAEYDEAKIYEIQMKPSYHDLIDLPEGYTEGAQINFFNINMRYNEETDVAYLQELSFIDIFSLTSRNEFFKPTSWKARTGLEKIQLEKGKKARTVFHVDTAFGMMFGSSSSFGVFAMLNYRFIYHDSIENDYTMAYGPQAGFLWHVTSGWSMWLSLNEQHMFDNLHETLVNHEFTQNIAMSRDTALRLSVREYGIRDYTEQETKLSFLWYL
ncbi:MAG: DUF4105 domain-containing protein [Gammaproteobacteria bacterium]|nr:DUF4105 domain-containing protein [Gammaproteobacteria bacterium]